MNALQAFIASHPGGFLTEQDIPALIRIDRLCPVLVRCGSCRFQCAAQDVAHIIQGIDAIGDYVRDVSFPVGSDARAAGWQPECPVTPAASFPQSFFEPRPPGERLPHRSYGSFDDEWRGDNDGL